MGFISLFNNMLEDIFGYETLALKSTHGKMQYINDWFLMGSPMTPILVIGVYLLFVLKIGPNYMKNRKPYQLNRTLVVYNIVQVLWSLYLVYRAGKNMMKYGIISNTCRLDTDEDRLRISSAMYCYTMTKFVELMDTVFFVLRKKSNQISFLHLYHHTLMLITTWTCLKYEPIIHLHFLGILNSFVHMIMYSYYGLSAFPALKKYLWWKKYLTGLQLVQFLLVMFHFWISSFTSECKPSYFLLAHITVNSLAMLALFGNFYLKSYMKKGLVKDSKNKNGNQVIDNRKTMKQNLKSC